MPIHSYEDNYQLLRYNLINTNSYLWYCMDGCIEDYKSIYLKLDHSWMELILNFTRLTSHSTYSYKPTRNSLCLCWTYPSEVHSRLSNRNFHDIIGLHMKRRLCSNDGCDDIRFHWWRVEVIWGCRGKCCLQLLLWQSSIFVDVLCMACWLSAEDGKGWFQWLVPHVN